MNRIVETPTARSIWQLAEETVLTGTQSLIIGRSGVGKTAALTELARRDRLAGYMSLRPAQATLRGTLRLFGQALGIDCTRQHIYLDEVLMAQLPYAVEQGRYLIVDEAQMLPLLAVRQLQSYADHLQLYGLGALPIIFAGNEHLLKRTRAAAEGLDQILTRIGNGHRPLTIKAISAGDVDAFCVEFDVELSAYETVRRFAKGRNCRALVAVLQEARHLAGGGPIRSAAVREAMLSLHGPEAVKVIPFTEPKKQPQRKSA